MKTYYVIGQMKKWTSNGLTAKDLNSQGLVGKPVKANSPEEAAKVYESRNDLFNVTVHENGVYGKQVYPAKSNWLEDENFPF